MEKSELIAQTNLAFDFVQKLYFEVSYLIKEIEGILAQEQEEFILGQASGYAVTARSSNGLDTNLVNYWMYKKLAVFFAPSSSTQKVNGQTITPFKNDPKIIYVRIILQDKDFQEPTIFIGVLHHFEKKPKYKHEKIEPLMTAIEYSENKVFLDYENIDYADVNFSFKGKLIRRNLFELNTSDDIVDKLLKPGLELFRQVK